MPRGRPLTRAGILAAALDVIDADGLDALSMRNLAARLGVQAMSLYHHVADKAALLDGIHELLITSMDIDVEALSWDDALRRLAASYRAVALTHPHAFILLATRPVSTRVEVEHIAPGVAALARAGFPAAEQLFMINLFFCSLNGLLLAEVAPTPGHADVPNPDLVAAFAGATGAQPQVGELGALLADIESNGGDTAFFSTEFDAYVDVLLAGLRARYSRT